LLNLQSLHNNSALIPFWKLFPNYGVTLAILLRAPLNKLSNMIKITTSAVMEINKTPDQSGLNKLRALTL